MTKKKKIVSLSLALLLLLVVVRLTRIAWMDIPEKLSLHRSNSLEKTKEFEDKYANFEMDVVVRGDSILDVTHDEKTTFHLNVEEVFAYLAGNERKVWLDIKNLSKVNTDSIVHLLSKYVERYGVDKSRFVIESGYVNGLAIFTKAGFYTSYYVPFDKPLRLSSKEREQAIHQLREIVDSGHVEALSFPGWWYFYLKRHLDRDIDLLTWKHRSSWFEVCFLISGQIMLQDEQLKVILVKDKGTYHR